MIRLAFLLLLLTSILASCSEPKKLSPLDQKLTSLLDSLREKSDYPGVVFAYVDSLGKTHTITSGWANMEDSVKMTGDHLLHSGSTGKVIVSAVTMQLVSEGQLDLDELMKAYIGDYDWYDRIPNADSITLRHLLQHTSGMERYEFKEAFIEDLHKNAERVWTPEDLIFYVLDDEPLFSAGTDFAYADTNYILVGMIIEKVTGQKFYDLAYQRVLQPLGLTSFTPTNTRKVPNMAQGYFDPESEYALGFKSPFLNDDRTQNNMQWEWTGGGYAYKTSEYAELLKFVYEGHVFDMKTTGDDYFGFVPSAEIGGEYALGVHKLTFPNLGEFIGHGGFFPGYNTMGLYHPKSGMSFAMQINITDLPQLRAFFGDYLMMVGTVKKG
ncbi:MAG: serine hydrolase domain-containing protein [Cyclobacteriaceae bacterium]